MVFGAQITNIMKIYKLALNGFEGLNYVVIFRIIDPNLLIAFTESVITAAGPTTVDDTKLSGGPVLKAL